MNKYRGKITKGEKSEHRDVHAEITQKIVAQLESGVAPWVKPWTVSARHSGMPRNAISKRDYSGINVLLLWIEAQAHGYQSAEWLTFKQAKEKGGHVRAGEKGTQVVFYKKLSFAETNDTGEAVDKSVMMARVYTVFNVEQCEGLKLAGTPAPIVSEITPDGLNANFMDAVRKTAIEIRHGGNSAHYMVPLDYVQMPHLATFKSAEGYQSTLAHELTHATGAKKRLDRFESACERTDYPFEELVAELGAAFTAAQFGFSADTSQSAAYIKSWIKLLTSDKRAIFRAASRASKAVAYLYPERTAEEADAESEEAIAA